MKNVLLIDDVREPKWIQRPGTSSYEHNNYTEAEVEVAKNGQDGIEALKARKWDTVLLDHDMGWDNKNGMDVIRFMDDNREYIPSNVYLVTANIIEGPKMLEYIRRWAQQGLVKDWDWLR